MELIDEFLTIYKKEYIDTIHQYMVVNGILDEFKEKQSDLERLFEFSVKYGIIEFVRFLYEEKGIEYNFDLIASYDSVMRTDLTKKQLKSNAHATTGSSNDKVILQVWDKFSKNRNICIRYLIQMKKYSKYRFCQKKSYYRFDEKHRDIIVY